MSEDGYTLAEMLGALLMIGLALTGLAQGLRVIGVLQTSTAASMAEERGLRTAETRLTALVTEGRPGSFKGSSSAVSFDCGGADRCAALITSAGLELREGGRRQSAFSFSVLDGARLVYDGAASSGLSAWPPEGPRQSLRAIRLVAKDDTPLLVAPVWREQSGACAFDPIAQECREDAA